MNMSYCRFENTWRDLVDCRGALQDILAGEEADPLSASELAAAGQLVFVCAEILQAVAEAGSVDEETVLDWCDRLPHKVQAILERANQVTVREVGDGTE